MSIFSSLRAAGSGLSAERLRMDVIANNVANVDTTRTPQGGAYRRETVVFTPQQGGSSIFEQLRSGAAAGASANVATEGVQVAQVAEDQSPTRQVYDPTNVDANPNGYVEYPNVNIVTEMTDMISATRSYQANVTTLNAAKGMAMRALDIGRA